MFTKVKVRDLLTETLTFLLLQISEPFVADGSTL